MIGTSVALSVWPSLRRCATTALQQIPGAGAPDDEGVWASVRSDFELVPEFTDSSSL